MRISTIFGATLALSASFGGFTTSYLHALELAQAKVSFVKPPNLLSATTTYNQTDVWGATYYFTIELPANAGRPLQQVTIKQVQGFDNIRFNSEETRAFEGKPRHKGEKLTLKEVTYDIKTNTISVIFDPPVSPGKTVTIALHPVRNPDTGGAYLFGVTAFPLAENPYGLYLGVGSLEFYDHDSDFGLLRFHR